MAQSLKPEVRARLLAQAEQLFAEAGYQGATMAAIAERAGLSTGNTYRYFANKDALFYEVVSPLFAARFMRLLKRRLSSLLVAPELTALNAQAQADGEALLRFWLENRLKVIILLDRAAGSRHEGFADAFVDALLRPSLAKLREGIGEAATPVLRLLLQNLFRNTLRMVVAILESSSNEVDMRRAFQGFWAYQLAGLAGLTKWVSHG
jgi:AcrR family transcriptional regulator